jgi:thiol-disulfide isomerase/thioredoxin
MPITASKHIERVPDHEKEFNTMDFAGQNLIHSGLYKELLDGYFLLMESNGAIENVYIHANASTNALLKSLEKHPELKQEVAEYLFRLFEKRSLFQAAEHLALAMLNDQSCEMDSKHEALFEQYRKMARGKTADDIVFENATKPVAKMSDLKSKYKLVVFGASWCSKCQEEIPKLIPYCEYWKTKYDLEIVFISLDTEKEKFRTFVKDFPWLSSCELKGWESKVAIDYCIFGTPTMYLLDNNNTILVKPISEKQIQAWLEMIEKK